MLAKMRGLAFPSHAVFDREPSYEYGTPLSTVDDIPIDPALGGPAINLPSMGDGSGAGDLQVSPLKCLQDIACRRNTTRRACDLELNTL